MTAYARYLLAGLTLALASCATTVTQSTLPDGTVVTVTAKSADPVAVKAATDAAVLLMPVIDNLTRKQTPTK